MQANKRAAGKLMIIKIARPKTRTKKDWKPQHDSNNLDDIGKHTLLTPYCGQDVQGTLQVA
jgi:hypothetical protein